MATLEQIVDDFLAQRRIAVAGVSSTEPNAPANLILRKLRDAGHEVFAVNPKVDTVEGGPCHPSLAAIPGGVDAVVAAKFGADGVPEGFLPAVPGAPRFFWPRPTMPGPRSTTEQA